MTTAAVLAGLSAVALAAALTQLHGLPTAEAAPPAPVWLGRMGPAGRAAARLGETPTGRPLVVGLVVGVAAAVIIGPSAGGLAGLGAGGVWAVRSRRAAAARRLETEAAIPALARSLADALRGGASVRGAVAAAGQDAAVPHRLRSTIERHAAALAVGAPLAPTLQTLAHGAGPTMRLLCGTLALHLDAGGALASELDRLAADAEAARRVEEDRRAATAQARATVRVVAALPLVAMGGAQVASPAFVGQVVGHPIALALLLLGLVLEMIAVIAARAIVGSGG